MLFLLGDKEMKAVTWLWHPLFVISCLFVMNSNLHEKQPKANVDTTCECINMECDDQATRSNENLSQPLWILSGIQCETSHSEFP